VQGLERRGLQASEVVNTHYEGGEEPLTERLFSVTATSAS